MVPQWTSYKDKNKPELHVSTNTFPFIWHIIFSLIFFPSSCLSVCSPPAFLHLIILPYYIFSLTRFLLYLLLFLPVSLLIERPLAFLQFCLTLPFPSFSHFNFIFMFRNFLFYSLSLTDFIRFTSFPTWSPLLSPLTTDVIKQTYSRAIVFN